MPEHSTFTRRRGHFRRRILRAARPGRGPVAALFCENAFLFSESAAWLLQRGAQVLVIFGAAEELAPGLAAITQNSSDARAIVIDAPIHGRADAAAALAALADWAAGHWVVHCFNGEFPVYPYFETRSLADLAAFQEGERRSGVGGWTLDLYAEGMGEAVEAADPGAAAGWFGAPRFDAGGVFAATGPRAPWEAPRDEARPETQRETRPRIYGGLGWRWAERLEEPPPRLDRTPFFLARKGMRPDADFAFGDPLVDGIDGPWHRSPTMAVASFRAAHRLLADPAVAAGRAEGFAWAGSRRWDWSSAALLEAGAIEPGQWF